MAGSEASTSGRGDHASQNRSARYTATILDVGPEAAAKAVRECCVFIVPQADNPKPYTVNPKALKDRKTLKKPSR